MKTKTLGVALAALIVPLASWQAVGRAVTPNTDPVDVSGVWRLDQVRIRSSSCPTAMTDIVRNDIQRGDLHCTFRLEQAGPLVDVSEICPDGTVEFQARVDASGELRHSESTSFEDESCQWRFSDTLTAELGRDPATLIVLYLFEFDVSCGIPDCAIELTGRLRRAELAHARAHLAHRGSVQWSRTSISRGRGIDG